MNLKERLSQDMKLAMKAKDSVKLSTIRMTISALKNKEIELGKELGDDGILDVISKAVKQRRDSAKQYRDAGREDLANNEEAEIKVLTEYLPSQMTEDEIKKVVDGTITEAGAESMKDMGKVMKLLMPKVQGKADGAVVNKIVKATLSGG